MCGLRVCCVCEPGGNQRELARQKNAKKQAVKSKGASGQDGQDGSKGASLEQRKHRSTQQSLLSVCV